ncbi:hypothetical protein ACFV4K_28700 [Nocardia sp. NPDC059764]|uniref:hypothetical protein n=1 Tax=Nocardia sp. NPDC059764 TaxID=3346939 RepID=UPI0036473CA7
MTRTVRAARGSTLTARTWQGPVNCCPSPPRTPPRVVRDRVHGTLGDVAAALDTEIGALWR